MDYISEHELTLKSVADNIIDYRYSNGRASISIIFSVLSLMLAKNKINESDVDIILNIEKKNILSILKDFYAKSFGSESATIKNERELGLVEKYCIEYIDNFKLALIKAAEEMGFKKRKKRDKGYELPNV